MCRSAPCRRGEVGLGQSPPDSGNQQEGTSALSRPPHPHPHHASAAQGGHSGAQPYVGAFMAQYMVSSVIQGLLGRQPDMTGSWGTYCSLNLRYLHG